LAGSNRRRGCEFAEIFALLLETNKRLEDPAPESHIRRIVEDVCRYEPGDKPGIGRAVGSLRELQGRGTALGRYLCGSYQNSKPMRNSA
jgi:hypothetical protein